MRRGGSLPDSQSISLMENTGAVSVAAATTSGGPWLRATASARSVEVSIVPDLARTLANGTYTGHVAITAGSSTRLVPVTLAIEVVHVAEVANSAAYTSGRISPGGLFTLFGSNFAMAPAAASGSTAAVNGVSVSLTDAAGAIRDMQLIYVSPAQVNFIAPENLAAGHATLTVTAADGRKATVPVEVGPLAPGLFSADGTGRGVAAATILRVAADGSRSVTLAADCTGGTCRARPIDMEPVSDSIYVVLYGTGIRGCSKRDAVSVTVGGIPAEVLYSGPQQQAGVDQINIALPREVAGRDVVEVTLTADGQPSNVLTLAIQ